MRVFVKCFATLGEHTPPGGSLELAEGLTVGAVLDRIGLTPEEIKLVFVNSKNSSVKTVLAEGDQVGLFPAVGGG